MAHYIFQAKYLQQLKENDEKCVTTFEKSFFLIFAKGRPLLCIPGDTNTTDSVQSSSIKWTSFSDTILYCQNLKNSSVLLAIDESTEDTPLFACRLDDPSNASEIEIVLNGKLFDIRTAIVTLPENQANLLSRAYTLLNWNDSLKFCSNCGSPLKRNVSGTVKQCTKPCDAKKSHYPPIYPVAIIRVVNNSGDKALLVRKRTHPRGMYSCVAGFMEPGETLQDCVKREVAEEAGVVVENIKYFQSQSWPLPQNSLMLACTAVAVPGSEKLDVDKGELEDGRWFSKSEVRCAYERVTENRGLLAHNPNGDFLIPPSGAVAHQLLQSWVSNYFPTRI